MVGFAVVKPVVWGRTAGFRDPSTAFLFSPCCHAGPPPRARVYSPVYNTVAAWYSVKPNGNNSRRILKHILPLGWS